MKRISVILIFWLVGCSGQVNHPAAIIDKSISAHDPNSYWPRLHQRFSMSIKRDGQANRYFSVLINNAENVFEYALQKGDSVIVQGVKRGQYYSGINGKTDLNDEAKEKYQLTNERTQYLKEVYEYLYGVPMKLKDPGTTIDPAMTEETFNGQQCWVIRVTYDPSMEGETWYFYINQDTYLLAGYRFYFDETKGVGEFIYIDGYDEVNGLKLAKTKKWHWNKDSAHFRTDELTGITPN
jgi:hypothetical protein